MIFFSKFLNSKNSNPKEQIEKDSSKYKNMQIDEQFVFNFKKNGGKFLYCESIYEVKEQFEYILEENDWFENEANCFTPHLFSILDENKISFKNVSSPVFFFSTCESLIADEGIILLSSNQLKQHKLSELPANFIVFATTTQIMGKKSDGLSELNKRHEQDLPTNITFLSLFDKNKSDEMTQNENMAKNVYLLLLETP